jgi:acyl-CoA hydrolase/RimJ/RimL family protein N-acetyltransferase
MPTEQEPLAALRERYPGKFEPTGRIFETVHRGDRVFIGTGCGQPQHLVEELARYAEDNPKAFFDAEVVHIWSLGVSPYLRPELERNFRLDSFFLSGATRDAVNEGRADYTAVFLSKVPELFRSGMVPIDVALVQTSLPDEHGFLSLGISVDIVRAAVDCARTVICQVNRFMPRTHGDSFIHSSEVDYLVPYDEPLLEYEQTIGDEVSGEIGRHVARLVEDGTTIQVGYGAIPDAILEHLAGKNDLGVHTELLSDGIADLMRRGVVTNARKSIDRHKSVAAFCMGSRATYEFLADNPAVSFRSVDYTNSPTIIAQQRGMTAINSALEIDLTGQTSAESLGTRFYSGIGGHADFMRGALLAPEGRTILVLPSTAKGGEVSRIVPFLTEGAGVTLTRGDVQYVVTEFGIAYLHGKNVRERAMALIDIAHPRFQSKLLEQAKAHHLIYQDQAYIPGQRGRPPQDAETVRTTRAGLEVLLRPVRISDEPLLKEFFYSLSDQSIYRRFMSARRDMPHERLQSFAVIDYTKEMVLLATIQEEDSERVVGLGQYGIDDQRHAAEVALVVRDDHQRRGIGSVLLQQLTVLAKKQGLLGFTAEVLVDNRAMMGLFESSGFSIEKRREGGVYQLTLRF